MTVLITGITSGFGRAMAEQFAAAGHKVYGTYRHASEPIPGVVYIKADVTDDAQVAATVNQVLEAEGRIDIFINNAGMGFGGPLEFASVEDARRQMDVNWLGMVRFVTRIVPAMRKQRGGKIFCFSSIGGLMGLPFQGLYSASKFAIEGYCEALRLETRDTGIRIIVIEVHAAYPKYAKSLSSIEHDENTGLKPEYLARKILKIAGKRHPAYHYIIASPLQKLSVFAKRILPSRWFAWILSLYYKLV